MDSIGKLLVSNKLLILPILVVLGAFLFDVALGAGLFLVFILSGISVFALRRLGLLSRGVVFLLAFALLIHIGAVLFFHYADFQPFSGGTGDYTRYQVEAEEIASRVRQGNFSLEGVGVAHAYPVVVGYAYALTTPSPLVGQMVNVWVAALAILFLYLLVLELGASKNWAFSIGVLGTLHPSFLFFSGLLLKDIFVIAFALLALSAGLKLLRRFSLPLFAVFYLALIALVHLRFYIGLMLIGVFLASWVLASSQILKKRILYGFYLLLVLGTVPAVTGHGYLGAPVFQQFLNPTTLQFYKDRAYKPTSADPEENVGRTSSFESFGGSGVSRVLSKLAHAVLPGLVSSSEAFEGGRAEKPGTLERFLILPFLGPFPWQIREAKHAFLLIETIPWYLLYVLSFEGAFRLFRKNKRMLLPLLFALAVLGTLALFFSNFGIISRIRIPAMLTLLAFIPFSLTAQRIGRSIGNRFKRYGI